VSSKRGSYSPEFKEAAVREVIDQSRPIADVARRLGLVEQTLGTWVKAFRAEHAGEAESELPVSVLDSLTRWECDGPWDAPASVTIMRGRNRSTAP
jgi:transposase-like protein